MKKIWVKSTDEWTCYCWCFVGAQPVLFDNFQGNFIGIVCVMTRLRFGLKHWTNQTIGNMLSASLWTQKDRRTKVVIT